MGSVNSKEKFKIAILCGFMPTYRKGFYDNLFKNSAYDITVYCQERLNNFNLKSIHHLYPNNVSLVRSFSFKNELISFQFLPFIKLFLKYDLIVIEGNPRNISHFFFSTFCLIFNKKVVLWTMAHSSNSNTYLENARLLWTKFFNFLFVYTEAETDYLRIRGFRRNTIISMNNGLNQDYIDLCKSEWDIIKLATWKEKNNISDKICLISSARLDKKNKFEYVLHALSKLVLKYPKIFWILIGDGNERPHLVNLSKKLKLENNVAFIGELYSEEELCPWFLSSDLFIHPGSIGLSLMHAYGYGLPVITHNNISNHSPEISIFKDNHTGFFYEEGNLNSFIECLSSTLYKREKIVEMGKNAYSIVRDKYNTNKMSTSFFDICSLALKR